MVTLRTSFVLLVLCLSPGLGKCESWLPVATDRSSDVQHFYDADSIRPEGEYLVVWSREVLARPIYRGILKPAGHERLTHNALDCERNSLAILSFIVRGKDGQTLDNVATPPSNVRFSAMPPGSVGAQLVQTVCKRFATGQEVAAFAADPAHPFFDEVSDQIIEFIKAGMSLAAAYEKAVMANPVTREKELARRDAEKLAQAGEPSMSFGTVWLSDTGYLVTAYHVIEDASKLAVLLPDKSVINVRVVLADPVNDLAILSATLPTDKLRGLRISRSQAALGATVFTVGFPHPDMLGVKPKFTLGQVSSTAGLADDPRLMQITTPVQAGNSGGPLLNQDGEVVGVVSAKLSATAVLEATGDLPQNVNYAVKGRYLLGLLSDVPKAETVVTGIKPGSVEEIAAQMHESVFLLLAQ